MTSIASRNGRSHTGVRRPAGSGVLRKRGAVNPKDGPFRGDKTPVAGYLRAVGEFSSGRGPPGPPMRPRTISLGVTLGVFLGGLALVWILTDGNKSSTIQPVERVFTFPLNSTSQTVSVRSPWKLGHMTPQDDQVELTLEGGCATAHLYAYLSKGWDHGPLNAASVILGIPLHPGFGTPAPRVVRSDTNTAILLSRTSGRV